MGSAQRGRNSVVADRTESWEWQAPSPLSVSSKDSPNKPKAFVEGFDLEAHWERGGRSPLFYFCDTGVLHRLFSDRMRQAGWNGPHRARSWEGFVIRTICQRFGKDAEAWVFRHSDTHEIDLVLRWPDTPDCWAIEIGAGTNKRPSVGFWKGIDIVSATNLIVIHRGRRDEIGECQRMTLAQLLTEY